MGKAHQASFLGSIQFGPTYFKPRNYIDLYMAHSLNEASMDFKISKSFHKPQNFQRNTQV